MTERLNNNNYRKTRWLGFREANWKTALALSQQVLGTPNPKDDPLRRRLPPTHSHWLPYFIFSPWLITFNGLHFTEVEIKLPICFIFSTESPWTRGWWRAIKIQKTVQLPHSKIRKQKPGEGRRVLIQHGSATVGVSRAVCPIGQPPATCGHWTPKLWLVPGDVT